MSWWPFRKKGEENETPERRPPSLGEDQARTETAPDASAPAADGGALALLARGRKKTAAGLKQLLGLRRTIDEAFLADLEVKMYEADFGPDFRLGEEEWKALRHSMAEGDVVVSDSVWQADRDFILWELRMDLATAANLGQTARYRILVEEDVQLAAALDQFPQAEKIMALAGESRPRRAVTTKRR